MAEDEQTINLRILSPSAEVEGGVTLADVPASTTVKELRSRIQHAVPSKPAPERMRLIYRGRVVANDADTLGSVFGVENIRESKDQSLHLVLRELPPTAPSPAPPSSTAPPNPQRPQGQDALAANPLQTNPFRTLPQPRPSSQPQTPHPHHHPLPGQANVIALPLPPQVQQQLAQAMAHQGQPSEPTTEQPDGETQAPADGAHPPPPGLAPLPPLGLPNLPGNAHQPLRREGIGPNGARWSVTYNQVNIPARIQPPAVPFPIPHALGFGRRPLPTGTPPLGSENQRLLPRIQRIFLETQREMDNIRTLLQSPAGSDPQNTGHHMLDPPALLNVPAWRVEHLRQHLDTVSQNLNVVDRALALLSTEPEVVVLRQSSAELRVDAVELRIMLDRQQVGAAPGQPTSAVSDAETAGASSNRVPGAPTMTPAVPTTSQPQAQNATQAIPTDAPAELFLLSSPQGPVGLLFDQQGTYTTAPMVSTLPFQTFSSQFVRNRQLIAGLGQQMAQGQNQFYNQLANMQPTPTQQLVPGGQAQDQNQAQDQVQNQNQNANANAPQPEGNDRMVNVAGHLWLIFKLAVFVYFFAGGGGLYRPIMLGLIAVVVYLAQVGMFEDQFNLIRRHFEALLPIGAMAERVAQPNNQRQRGNMTPEEAARRILQQRRDQRFGWIRDSMRGVERAFALFVASLFPGVGERMVHAQEERERLERVAAEEERQRHEDEARRREEEEVQTQQDQQSAEKRDEAHMETEGDPSSITPSSKGKERVEEPQSDPEASAS